jgi:sodium transport system permease protein
MNARALWVVLRKELLDAFRDRRMVLVAFLLMPLAVPLVLAGTTTLGARKQTQQLESPLKLPVIGAEHAPNLVGWLRQRNVEVLPPPEDADAAVRAQEYDVVLRIDPEYGTEWRAGRPAHVELIFDSSRPLASGATITRARRLLESYSQTVGMLRLVAARLYHREHLAASS